MNFSTSIVWQIIGKHVNYKATINCASDYARRSSMVTCKCLLDNDETQSRLVVSLTSVKVIIPINLISFFLRTHALIRIISCLLQQSNSASLPFPFSSTEYVWQNDSSLRTSPHQKSHPIFVANSKSQRLRWHVCMLQASSTFFFIKQQQNT